MTSRSVRATNRRRFLQYLAASLWGLGAFGEEGVARVLELLRTETRAAMQQCGVRSIGELNASYVHRAT